jgi:hypothetical protein
MGTASTVRGGGNERIFVRLCVSFTYNRVLNQRCHVSSAHRLCKRTEEKKHRCL